MTQPASPVPASQASRIRVIQRGGARRTPVVGASRRPFNDAYHFILTVPWSRFMLFVIGLYLSLNVLFASLYLAGGDCIQGAEPGRFSDAFFFSVQTLATIGYGAMAPKTTWSHWLVTIEAFVGMLTVAMVTGLMFAKFSKPTARVEFSHFAIIAPRNGLPTLMFRMSNQRANQIVEARIQVAVVRTEVTQEGETMRRFYDLQMVRQQNILFALTWTAMHEIDAASPLYGCTKDSVAGSDMEIVVSMVGMDEAMSQPVHARWSYVPEELRWNCRFVDIIRPDGHGGRVIDLRYFHDVEPLPAANA